jgi:hypothetical protein
VAKPIDPASRTIDIVERLNQPESYVCGVLGNMWKCKREHRDASVRIGVTGHGKSPNYLVEYSAEGSGSPPIFGAFHGRSHKKFVEEAAVRDEHWSEDVMYFSAVQELIGKIRSKPGQSSRLAHLGCRSTIARRPDPR